MSPMHVMHTLGAVPFFSSRAFVTAFVIAFLARFGNELQILDDIPLIGTIMDQIKAMDGAAWFTHDITLLVLGILAFLEIAGTKFPEVRELLNSIDSEIKSIIGFLASFALIDGSKPEVVNYTLLSGISLGHGWAIATGGAIWGLSKMRNRIHSYLMELDPDDDFGVQKLLSWAEDAWSVLGVMFLVIFPLLALIVAGLTAIFFFIVKRYIQACAEKTKTPCPECGKPNYLTALNCFSCNHTFGTPHKVGLLGSASKKMSADFTLHRRQLTAWKRCPVCATRLKEKRLRQKCNACGFEVFNSPMALEQYLDDIKRRLPKTLGICMALSFVPIIGLIPGIIYYKVSLIADLRGYIPRSTGFLARWTTRIINIFLIFFQPTPILGAFVLPLMCFTNYSIYRRLIERQSKTVFAPVQIETSTGS